MAAVDGLLSLLLAQAADTLTLSEGQAPQLTKAGEPKPLSMPPLLPELLGRFVEEVRGASADGTTYVHESKGTRTTFAFAIDDAGSIRFQRADAHDAVASAGSPASAHVPDASTAGAEAPLTTATPQVTARAEAPRGPAEVPADGPLAALIERALAAEATDLFLSTAADARLRVGMELRELPGSRVGESDLLALARLDDAHLERLEKHGSIDLGLRFGSAKLRVNLFRHLGGLAAAIRPLRRVRTLAELSLPPDLERLTEPIDGLVLLVGPTGSGKSSTLAALLDHVNATRAKHILTIEDPVEYEYESRRCLVHQREVGRDVESFAAGLRAALRESPDVILVGEMRDRETFAAAMTAAETGHLVFSTLHSGNAAMAIDRIVDSFPPHQQTQVRAQLANVLRAIVTQLLLPGVQPGRLVPATERMFVTHAIAHKIREGRGHQITDLILTGRGEGMVTLEMSLAELVKRGQISMSTARGAARNPDVMRDMLQQMA